MEWNQQSQTSPKFWCPSTGEKWVPRFLTSATVKNLHSNYGCPMCTVQRGVVFSNKKISLFILLTGMRGKIFSVPGNDPFGQKLVIRMPASTLTSTVTYMLTWSALPPFGREYLELRFLLGQPIFCSQRWRPGRLSCCTTLYSLLEPCSLFGSFLELHSLWNMCFALQILKGGFSRFSKWFSLKTLIWWCSCIRRQDTLFLPCLLPFPRQRLQ